MLAATGIALVLSGCSDTAVSVGEIKKLEGLEGVRVAVDRETVRVGRDEAVAGVATDGAQRVYFTVIVGEARPLRATIRGRTYRLVSGCGGASFYAEGSRFDRLASAVESAVYDMLAPDAYCEG